MESVKSASIALSGKLATTEVNAARTAPDSRHAVEKPSNVESHFNDFRQVVEKSTGKLADNRKQLEEAVQELKRTSDTAGRALGFRIDPAVSGTAIVTVSNLETGQVIRQIPDEVVVRVAHSIEQMKGLLFDGKL